MYKKGVQKCAICWEVDRRFHCIRWVVSNNRVKDHPGNKHSPLPESDCEWDDVDESIDLEDTEEENSEVLKCLGEEVPEQAKVGGLVRNSKTTRSEEITFFNAH